MDSMQYYISVVVMILLAIISLYWIYLDNSEKVDKKTELKTPGNKSSGLGIVSGLSPLILPLGIYFLLPLNDLLEIPDKYSKAVNALGIELNLTLSSLFSACSNPAINLIFQQCQTVNFFSYIIFIIAFIGGILLIKGILYS